MSEGQIASVMAYAGFLGCFAAIGIDVLCKKCSKKAAWIIACGIEGASMIALVGIFIKPGQLTMIYVLVTLMALGLAAIYQVPWSMIPDCVDVQELATKKRLDGIVFGFIAFIQKVSGAVAIALVGTSTRNYRIQCSGSSDAGYAWRNESCLRIWMRRSTDPDRIDRSCLSAVKEETQRCIEGIRRPKQRERNRYKEI